MKNNKVPKSFQAWQTPRPLFEGLSRSVGGYGIDLFACQNNHLCKKYFTEKQDAIMQSWVSDKVAFANPPYAHGWADETISKAILEVRTKKSLPGVDILIKCDTSTKVFFRAFHECEIQLFTGRIAYELPKELGKAKNGNNFASMLVRVRDNNVRGITGFRNPKTGVLCG